MSSIKQSFDANYERNYKALNRKENEYPEFQLAMNKKLDSGEVFPTLIATARSGTETLL